MESNVGACLRNIWEYGANGSRGSQRASGIAHKSINGKSYQDGLGQGYESLQQAPIRE